MAITEIASVFGFLKAASELAKSMWKGSVELEQGELKLKLGEIIQSLLEANLVIVEIQNKLNANENEILRLQEALSIKGDVVRLNDAYYMKDDNGSATGTPYCLRCYENSAFLYGLIISREGLQSKSCPQCKTSFRSLHCVDIAQ